VEEFWTWLNKNAAAVTALASVVLAGVTYAYVRSTRKAIMSARDTAEATARAAGAAEKFAMSAAQLVELEFLPVVWGRLGSHSSHSKMGEPKYSVQVYARNVGRGVALRVECWLTAGGENSEPWPAGEELDPITREGRARFETSKSMFDAVTVGEYAITCSYFDAAGRRFESRGSPSSGVIVEIAEDGTERRLFQR
jgi:hypothetical protein